MKKMKFLKDFTQLSEREKLTFSEKEIWENCYAIGIDSGSKKLLYYNSREGKGTGTLIDLSEVESCRLVITDRHIKGQNSSNNYSNRIELVLSLTNSKKSEKVLEFYNNAEFMPDTDEISKVEYWLNINNSNLKSS